VGTESVNKSFIDFEYDQFDRKKKIRSQLDDYYGKPTQPTWPINFKNEECDLPIIQVSIKLPMYRLENGRTLSLQDEFLAKNPEVAEDFFLRDNNSPEAQSIQYDLLMQLSSTKDLYKTFEDTKTRQSEPLIITKDGFVVNGNRRLSCWRNLFFGNPESYRHFEYIKVAVLPTAEEQAIEDLEARLQIIPDIRADYSWHTEARLMKKRVEEKGESIETVARAYRMKAKDIEDRMEMLEYAREYLLRNNLDRQWSVVTDDLYLFQPLVSNRKKFTSATEKSIFESLNYSVLTASKGGGRIEGRLYEVVSDVRKYFNPIVDEVKKEFSGEEVRSPAPEDDSDLLLENTALPPDELTHIAATLIDAPKEKQMQVAEIVQTVIADEQAKEKDRKSSNYLLSQVKKADSALINAINSCTGENLETDRLDEYLESILLHTEELKRWLTTYEDNN
jgi:hypothetical protein